MVVTRRRQMRRPSVRRLGRSALEGRSSSKVLLLLHNIRCMRLWGIRKPRRMLRSLCRARGHLGWEALFITFTSNNNNSSSSSSSRTGPRGLRLRLWV